MLEFLLSTAKIKLKDGQKSSNVPFRETSCKKAFKQPGFSPDPWGEKKGLFTKWQTTKILIH